MSSKGIYISLIGPGGVGSIFLHQLRALTQSHPHGSNIHLIAILRSKSSLRATNASKPLDLSNWETDLSTSTQPSPNPEELSKYLTTTFPPRRCIVVDTTSSQTIAEAYPLFLSKGISVITANKKAFSSGQALFDEIFPAPPSAGRGLMYHESSVGAGMPILSTLRELLATGDKVKRIEGVMSGSLSYLFNNFMPLSPSQGESSWSVHVAEAQRLGYTEPDPRDDLSGLDVARKLVILARVAGLKVADTNAFPVQSLVPTALASGVDNGDEFVRRLKEFDGEMEGLRREVVKEEKVLRYVGSVDLESGSLSVKMVRVGKESPFAGLRGSANVFGFWTERYGAEPLVVQGAGAGGEVTAMGVTGDLIKVIERLGVE